MCLYIIFNWFNIIISFDSATVVIIIDINIHAYIIMSSNLTLSRKYRYSETSLIRHLYNPTFSLIRPLYVIKVQSPYISMVRSTP